MFTKILQSSHGKEVSVTHQISRTKNNLHTVHFTVKCGSTIDTVGVIIGADNGPRQYLTPEDTKAQLQYMLDHLRQQFAEDASWKEMIADHISKIE